MNTHKYITKNKQTLKLFRFITIFSSRQRDGKTVYSVLGLPVWKVRRMEKENLIKYYLFNIPILRFYYVQKPTAAEVICSRLEKQLQSVGKSVEENVEDNVKKIVEESVEKIVKAQIDGKTFQQLAAVCKQNTEQLQDTDDRIRVYHAELLERLDNLPMKK